MAVGGRLRRRWVFQAGRLESERALTAGALRRLLAEQERVPVPVLTDERHTWWMAAGQVVRGKAELSADDVAALLAERAAREERRLERAHAARARAALPDGGRGRRAIPREVRLAVWERDGGRCTTCGSAFDLQYDHVIPVALGGGSTEENLQLLCGTCNREKGAAIA